MGISNNLESVIDAYRDRHTLCGALRISREGRVLFERAYGHASVQFDVANTLNTRFHIASMTKMFIAAAAVRLSLEGVVPLQAHPSIFVPELSGLDPGITLHHLLTHTAGLADIYDVPDLRMEMASVVRRGGTLLDYLASLPPLAKPGERWRYSTTGFLLLAYVLERATGSSFSQIITDQFLVPLGLANTGPDNPFLVNPGRATGQRSGPGGWQNARNDGLSEIEGPREFYSTVEDIDRWATALADGQVLNDAAMALSFSRHARVGPGSDFNPAHDYGYGWFLGDGYRWVGGVTAGFRAALWQYPKERLNVVMLWNNERIDSQGLFAALRPVLLAS